MCISKTWFLFTCKSSSAFLSSTIVVSRSLFLFQCRAAPPDATSNSLLEYGAHSAPRLPLVTPSLGGCTLASICTPTCPGEENTGVRMLVFSCFARKVGLRG